jgi:membrane-associated protease RseP (regulator of RpoE activity)
VAIDGRKFGSWTALSLFIQAHPGQRLDVSVERNGAVVHLYPVPVDRSRVGVTGAGTSGIPRPTRPTGFLGIEISASNYPGLAQSVTDAGGAWVHVSALTMHALGHLVTLHGAQSYFHMFTSKQAADNPHNQVRFASPVKVVQLFHQAGRDGLATVLYLLAVINISLGIFNLIPLLPLDGGHVAIALYEGARSRKRRYQADVRKLLPLFYFALILIVFLGASSLFLDIRDLAA